MKTSVDFSHVAYKSYAKESKNNSKPSVKLFVFTYPDHYQKRHIGRDSNAEPFTVLIFCSNLKDTELSTVGSFAHHLSFIRLFVLPFFLSLIDPFSRERLILINECQSQV